jgi:hypothetical protein
MYPDYRKICEERHGGSPAREIPFQWTHRKTAVVLAFLALAIPGYIYVREQVQHSIGREGAETVLMLLRCVGTEIKP